MTDAYRAALESAALFDTSAAGKILLTGPDAPQFLHNISTNDVNGLPLGGGCELFFCDARARALFAATVYHVRHDGDHALWLETTPGRDDPLFKHLDRYLIAEAVELRNVTAEYAQFHLTGPTAKAVLEAATGTPLPDLAELQHAERTLGADTPASVRRRSPLGLHGFDIVVPAGNADRVRGLLLAHGATAAGPSEYETLRIEAGAPLYGPDIDENRFVMEVGGGAKAVSYTKGCFPGQEPIVMARDRAGRVNRNFLGLRLSSAVPSGTKLTKDGQEVGVVTSVTESPRLGGPLALGYVHWKHVAPGTELRAGDADAAVIGERPVG